MIPLILLVIVPSVLSSKEVCPGGSFTCPDSATCCQLPDLSYGCCPMQNAVCCDDHIHCCPQSTKCDAGMCIKLDGRNLTSQKLSGDKIASINCFGTEFICPDDTTCCKGSVPDIYGCCPLEHAVCCEDGTHCCPEGTVCDVESMKCVGQGFISEMYDSRKNKSGLYVNAKYSALVKSNKVSSVVCPDSSFQCPNGYTCCQLPSGDWGCCPFVNAICCTDHLHCCPANMHCDATSQTCSQGLTSIPSIRNKIAEKASISITCLDNTTCSDSMTCCRMFSGHFGCCPYPNAQCCSDGQHCCPSDYKCDVEQKQCVPNPKTHFKSFLSYIKKLG